MAHLPGSPTPRTEQQQKVLPKIEFSLKANVRGKKNGIPKSHILAVILKKHFLFLAKMNESCFPPRNTFHDLRKVEVCFYYQLPADIQVGLSTIIAWLLLIITWPLSPILKHRDECRE